jgi:uncharacterized membrane-anchored protein
MDNEAARPSALAAPASKVAAVSASFWILKIVITTLGDLSGDALSISLRLGYRIALIVALGVTAMLLLVQLRGKRFHPMLYWALMLSSAAAGAEISDSIDRALHWGNLAGSAVLLAALLAMLAVWFARRGALRFERIKERQDEIFYWLAALLANSVGSALGDLFGDRLGLGVPGATLVNCAILAVLLGLHRTPGRGKGLLFWGAFVVTRVPL